ncbi:uncharacterized protein LOC110440245 [Mizuhopecten yessoensis]|uniref:uncharacterized protein LOC110440245 n=1 Tax=Mizuhopecten yessoensis TaxID=6573 RepID=UPI000B45863C|nr:uncharacterized protein LOC110440245 [Mizuhopecten yessoensis]
MYIRIKPQTWNERISLRFDVSGCYLFAEASANETFSRIPVITSSDYTEGLVLDVSTTSISKCAAMCKETPTCLSFTYEKGQDSCRGFAVAAPGFYGQFSSLGIASPCYLKKGKIKALGFRKLQGGTKYYNVIGVARNQSSAVDTCIRFSAQLFPLETASEVTTLQNVITGNDIMRRNFRLYVSGEYVSNQWQYNGVPKVIDGDLWSTNHPNPSQGHCVMLTETGLASVDCTEILFFICVI